MKVNVKDRLVALHLGNFIEKNFQGQNEKYNKHGYKLWCLHVIFEDKGEKYESLLYTWKGSIKNILVEEKNAIS